MGSPCTSRILWPHPHSHFPSCREQLPASDRELFSPLKPSQSHFCPPASRARACCPSRPALPAHPGSSHPLQRAVQPQRHPSPGRHRTDTPNADGAPRSHCPGVAYRTMASSCRASVTPGSSAQTGLVLLPRTRRGARDVPRRFGNQPISFAA